MLHVSETMNPRAVVLRSKFIVVMLEAWCKRLKASGLDQKLYGLAAICIEDQLDMLWIENTLKAGLQACFKHPTAMIIFVRKHAIVSRMSCPNWSICGVQKNAKVALKCNVDEWAIPAKALSRLLLRQRNHQSFSDPEDSPTHVIQIAASFEKACAKKNC